MNPPDVLERLLFHADRVEECGHLNAARYMRLAAEELEHARTESAARLKIINAKIIERDDARIALADMASTLSSQVHHTQEGER